MAMLEWNTYRQQLTVRIGEIAKISPDTIKGYQMLSAAGQKTNLLGPKTRELISLAVAVTIRRLYHRPCRGGGASRRLAGRDR
jgi:alkylhydroperoxidase/carboxymuconolactone decarboxylase family protein YurZ